MMTDPLIAPDTLLLALMQADVYPWTPTFATWEIEPINITVPSSTVVLRDMFKNRSTSSSMEPDSSLMMDRQRPSTDGSTAGKFWSQRTDLIMYKYFHESIFFFFLDASVVPK
jgi:hypothetical protein